MSNRRPQLQIQCGICIDLISLSLSELITRVQNAKYGMIFCSGDCLVEHNRRIKEEKKRAG